MSEDNTIIIYSHKYNDNFNIEDLYDKIETCDKKYLVEIIKYILKEENAKIILNKDNFGNTKTIIYDSSQNYIEFNIFNLFKIIHLVFYISEEEIFDYIIDKYLEDYKNFIMDGNNINYYNIYPMSILKLFFNKNFDDSVLIKYINNNSIYKLDTVIDFMIRNKITRYKCLCSIFSKINGKIEFYQYKKLFEFYEMIDNFKKCENCEFNSIIMDYNPIEKTIIFDENCYVISSNVSILEKFIIEKINEFGINNIKIGDNFITTMIDIIAYNKCYNNKMIKLLRCFNNKLTDKFVNKNFNFYFENLLNNTNNFSAIQYIKFCEENNIKIRFKNLSRLLINSPKLFSYIKKYSFSLKIRLTFKDMKFKNDEHEELINIIISYCREFENLLGNDNPIIDNKYVNKKFITNLIIISKPHIIQIILENFDPYLFNTRKVKMLNKLTKEQQKLYLPFKLQNNKMQIVKFN